jgi:Phage terminase, small subunit
MEYEIGDAGGFEMLAQACQALVRAEECAASITREGAVIDTERGKKEHPLLKHELAARAFCVRTLSKLGLNFEPLRAGPGKPPTKFG